MKWLIIIAIWSINIPLLIYLRFELYMVIASIISFIIITTIVNILEKIMIKHLEDK